jgi:hypothetical protein
MTHFLKKILSAFALFFVFSNFCHVRLDAIFIDMKKTASYSVCLKHLLSNFVNLALSGVKQFDPSSMRV